MIYTLNDTEIFEYINEDLPYFDLTTYIQGSSNKQASLEIFTREDITVSCTEEASKIATFFKCTTKHLLPSKTLAKKGEVLLCFEGSYENIHKAWKLCQILLEHCCKITTYTNKMLTKIQKINPKCQLLGTRKTFPFTKKLSIKAIMAGGAMVHRLNLSDTILFFPQHRALYKNDQEFFSKIQSFKEKMPEKKIVIESKNIDDCKLCFQNGADVIQLDKLTPLEIEKIVNIRNNNFLHVKLIAAGGINIKNVEEFAKTKVDAIVTSAFYSCGLADISSKISLL